MTLSRDTLTIYGVGPIYCSVCTSLADRDEIERLVNERNPTGISSRWSISTDATFASGEPNPCPCEQDASRQHFLMDC